TTSASRDRQSVRASARIANTTAMRRRSRRTDIGRPGFQPYAGSYASGTMAPRGPSGCWAMTHASPTRRQGSQFAFGATSPRTTTAVPDAVRNGSAPTGRSSSTTASSASHAGTGLWRRRDGSSGTGMIDFPANSGVAAADDANGNVAPGAIIPLQRQRHLDFGGARERQKREKQRQRQAQAPHGRRSLSQSQQPWIAALPPMNTPISPKATMNRFKLP